MFIMATKFDNRMKKKSKFGLQSWIYIFLFTIPLFLIFFIHNSSSQTAEVLTFLGAQFIFAARVMYNTGISNAMLLELEYDNKFYKKITLPKALRKIFFVTYSNEVYLPILSLFFFIFLCTFAVVVYVGIYFASMIFEAVVLPSNFSEIGLIFVITTVIIMAGHTLFMYALGKKVAKHKEEQERIAIAEGRKTAPLPTPRDPFGIKFSRWRKETDLIVSVRKALEKYCHRYQRQNCLYQADMAKIEQQILQPNAKNLEYLIEAKGKNTQILTVRLKQTGALVFQAPIVKK